MHNNEIDVERVVSQLDRFNFADDFYSRPGIERSYYDPNEETPIFAHYDNAPEPFPRHQSRQDFYEVCRDQPGSSKGNQSYDASLYHQHQHQNGHEVRNGMDSEGNVRLLHARPMETWNAQRMSRTAPPTANTTLDESLRRAQSTVPTQSAYRTTQRKETLIGVDSNEFLGQPVARPRLNKPQQPAVPQLIQTATADPRMRPKSVKAPVYHRMSQPAQVNHRVSEKKNRRVTTTVTPSSTNKSTVLPPSNQLVNSHSAFGRVEFEELPKSIRQREERGFGAFPTPGAQENSRQQSQPRRQDDRSQSQTFPPRNPRAESQPPFERNTKKRVSLAKSMTRKLKHIFGGSSSKDQARKHHASTQSYDHQTVQRQSSHHQHPPGGAARLNLGGSRISLNETRERDREREKERDQRVNYHISQQGLYQQGYQQQPTQSYQQNQYTDPGFRKKSYPNLPEPSTREIPREAIRPSPSIPLSVQSSTQQNNYNYSREYTQTLPPSTRQPEYYKEGNSTFYNEDPDYKMPPPLQLGLPNLGNTCYMNAVVQALAASESLANFFLNSGHTKTMQDRTRQQELNSQLHGSNGAVTKAFATLINKLYNNKCLEQDVRDFRAVVGDYSPDYKTYNQQDAQEFLNWLLDKVHEDLNLAKRDDNYNYSKNGEAFSPDDALAERRLAHYSVITNLFEGQLRSSIVCQSCHFQKFNFEPYMYVPLPIPHDINQKRPLFVSVVKPGQFSMTKYGIRVDAKGAISDVKSCLAEETKVPLSQMLILQLSPNGFRSNTLEVCQIATMSTREAYAVELQPTIDTYNDQTVNVVFVITVKNGPQVKRETDPFVLAVSRQWNYDNLSRKLFEAARQSVNPKVLESLPVGQYKLALIDTFNPSTYLDPNVSMPLLTQHVDQCIQHNDRDHPRLPKFIRITVEFPQHNRSLIRVDLDRIINHRSADCLAKDNAPYELTLQSCLSAYTSEEILEWRCERCTGKKANKQLKFNSCPQILILHLKRFRHIQNEITEPIKVDVSVKFPIEGLDMSPFVSPSNPQNGKRHSIIGKKFNKEMQATVSHSSPDDNIYDLFAVVNHKGDRVSSGHYTATVKNPTDGVWRTFDDTFVSQNTNPTEQSENAYLMFYERRSCRAERQNSKKASEGRKLPNPLARFTPPREKEMLMAQKSNGYNGEQIIQQNGTGFRRGDATRRAAKAALLLPLHTSKTMLAPATHESLAL
ncbi:unnamed protein product, partial [Mesorhabditis belari]|uniref:ubiquitinyl hydrolase 1 n=1 Tax=Mesorhabditis belari TaxID=2138241 RepID=A0AAF3FMC1_9BILA